jgi:hypothetical protein
LRAASGSLAFAIAFVILTMTERYSRTRRESPFFEHGNGEF